MNNCHVFTPCHAVGMCHSCPQWHILEPAIVIKRESSRFFEKFNRLREPG